MILTRAPTLPAYAYRRAPAHAVARAVGDAAARRVGLGPRVAHEALGGELGPVEVAARHLHAAQPQLAPHADRLQQGG